MSADVATHLKRARRQLPPHAGDCALSLIGVIQLLARDNKPVPPRVRALLARLAADDLRTIEGAVEKVSP